MNNLARRLQKLESSEGNPSRECFIVHAVEDGGIVSQDTMKWHRDTDDLLQCLGKQDADTWIISYPACCTAEELLTQLRTSKARNEEASRHLGKMGKILIKQGIAPVIAAHLEQLNTD